MRQYILGLVAGAVLVGCGTEGRQKKPGTESSGGGGAVDAAGQTDGVNEANAEPAPVDYDDPDRPVIVRAHWEMPMSSDGTLALLGSANSEQAIAATVAANVTFAVANDRFITPSPVGIASYGSLDVTALRDNDLRVCGPSGNARCTTAAVRVYTVGTAGAGLWSTVEGYGLPITSKSAVIGLDVAGAVTAASVAVGSTKVMKLTDFTASARLEVPISVDFTDAAAGSYASKLVVEYFVQ